MTQIELREMDRKRFDECIVNCIILIDKKLSLIFSFPLYNPIIRLTTLFILDIPLIKNEPQKINDEIKSSF